MAPSLPQTQWEQLLAHPPSAAAFPLGFARYRGLRIGDVSLALYSANADTIRLSRELEDFQDDCGDADITLSVAWVDALRVCAGEKQFDSGGVWIVSRDGPGYVFDFSSPSVGIHPYKRLIADGNFQTGHLLLSRQALAGHGPIYPLEYPADELLITNYLAFGLLGVEVHGCGLVDGQAGGQLFLGHSGAGKSTTTTLWKSIRAATILSDDRIILRLHQGELWMYGTPWHGEARFPSAAKARLNRIFLLQHGERNEMSQIPSTRAVGELFARCFPPFHSAAGLERTVEFLHRVSNAVPCYEFRFVPGAGAVDTVLGFHD